MLGSTGVLSYISIICFDYSHHHDPLLHICYSSVTPSKHIPMMVTQCSSSQCRELLQSLLQLLAVDFTWVSNSFHLSVLVISISFTYALSKMLWFRKMCWFMFTILLKRKKNYFLCLVITKLFSFRLICTY